MITQDCLKEILHYDPETGIFTYRKDYYKCKKGDVFGYTNGRGWLRGKIKGKHYKLHRLAFLYMTGEFPVNETDHINGIKDDNRWCNLREATRSQNMANIKSGGNSMTGYRGVTATSAGNYYATNQKEGKTYRQGPFKCPKEAHKAYCKKAVELFGEFAVFE